MTAAQTSPLALVKHWREASEMTKAARAEGRAFLPDGAPPAGLVSMPREDLYRWNSTAKTRDRVTAAAHYMGGQKMRDLIEQIPPGHGYFGKFVDKSYAFNGLVDDMYRAITYLYGKDKASRLGLDEAAAKASGVQLVRKTMPSFDEMTPLERTVIKSVFPFAVWMEHVMKYAYSYPYDHPFRVAVTASFARNELDDMGTGLPERFMQMFFVGEPDSLGNVTAVNIGGMNPFADLSNYFTISGFLGNTNPIISATLQTIGYDVGRGGPVLYPELNVDPFTGQLVAAGKGNIITNLIQSTIPQSRILTNLAGRSSEWKSLLANNPESAARMLQSQLGVPILFRDINVPQEQFKAEGNRARTQSTALSNAMRSGDYSEAGRYPGLRAYLDQIRLLDKQGQLDQYRPQELSTPLAK